MGFFGERKRLKTDFTIPLAAPVDLFVPVQRGQRGFQLAFSGGSNANPLGASTPLNSWDGVTAIKGGSQVFTISPAITAVVCDGVAADGSAVPSAAIATVYAGTVIPSGFMTPFVVVPLQATVGDITGVEIDVWPLFDDSFRSAHHAPLGGA